MEFKIIDIKAHLDSIAPPDYQEDYDNAGLIVGDPDQVVAGVLVCLDSIEGVIDEAIELGCNMVVAHHPIIFSGLKSLTYADYIEKTVIKAIKHDVAIFAIHTNLDNVLKNGVNEKIARTLGMTNVEILAPKEDSGIGSGCIGLLNSPMDEREFLNHLKKTMKTDCIKHTELMGKPISRVALCGGSGSFLLGEAISQNADIFISGDFKYHQFFDSNGKIVIADIGHYESEQYTIDLLSGLLKEKFPTFATHCTKINTNPIKYY